MKAAAIFEFSVKPHLITGLVVALVGYRSIKETMHASIVVFFVVVMCCFGCVNVQKRRFPIEEKLTNLEESTGGRIGLFGVDTGTNQVVQYRSNERFPLCSTFKVLPVAAILKKSESEKDLLSRRVTMSAMEVKTAVYAPITEKHLSDGMTIADLCAASVQYSDNAAANILMKTLGGPGAITAFFRSLGDTQSRLDRWEPDLSSAIPGDLRDTTTPEAIARTLQKLVLGNVLELSRREQLQLWLKGNTTGADRIRASVPKEWVVGDKTGTCDYGTTNDIGVIWPAAGAPIVVAIYFTQNQKDASPHNDVVASATQMFLTFSNIPIPNLRNATR